MQYTICCEPIILADSGKARVEFLLLKNILRFRETQQQTTKIEIFNSSVKSVMLYGAETWRMTKTTINKVQTFINNVKENLENALARED